MSNLEVDILSKLTEVMGPASKIISVGEKEYSSNIKVEELLRITKVLSRDIGARLVSLVATDDRKRENTFGLHYIFSIEPHKLFITLITKVSGTNPKVPSITLNVPAAHLFEREIAEFFGIVPVDHPDFRALLLHDEWPYGVFPLRKDFIQGSKPEWVKKPPYKFLRVQGDGVFEIPVGPVHAGIIEPGHFRFSVAGEPIIHLEIQLGYVHKGIEKLAEGKDCWEAVQIAERISGDATFAYSLAFCQAVEKRAKVKVPKRAEFLRVIFAELERCYNHLGDIAGIATDVGFPFGAAQMLRLREQMLQMNFQLAGHRLLRGVNIPGGVQRDLNPELSTGLRTFLQSLLVEFESIQRFFLETDSLMDRVEGTGVLTKKIALDLGGVGPSARASGVILDLRKDHPYSSYADLNFEVPVREEGDVSARMLVKMAEFKESISLILQALDQLPQGNCSETIKEIPAGSAIGWAESSRGEIVHWLRIDSDQKVDRLKIKSPSFSNWPLLSFAVQGNIVPDFPLINKSFNLSYSGNDR